MNMDRPKKDDPIDDLLDKYYWIEVLSGWLTAILMFGGFFLLYKDENNRYGWLMLYSSFVTGLVLLLNKHIILLIVLLVSWIKIKQGKLELQDPIGDAVREYLYKNRNKK